MASNLTAQVRNIAEVATADRRRRSVEEDHRRRARRDPAAQGNHQHDGGPAERFAGEVTRVAREVGTEGKLGGQAQVPGVAGTWKDLTDNVNSAGREPDHPGPQHRRGDHRRRRGDLSQEDHRRRLGRDPRAEGHHQHHGRPAERFAGEVTRVAREVGTEGKLGGQAQVPGVAGTWKDLTDNVNFMATNLTGQVRNIAEVPPPSRTATCQQEDHRRRARRDPAAQGHHQHDGRSAERLRRRGDARGARGRHRGQARRSGPGARRRRRVEGPHRQRQFCWPPT
jgi:hypothetical protein